MLEIEKEKVHDTIEKDRKRQIVWKEHMFTITSTPALKHDRNKLNTSINLENKKIPAKHRSN